MASSSSRWRRVDDARRARPQRELPLRLARRLAIDYGERRVGLAISDPTGTIASPAGHILRRPGKRPPVAEIIRRAEVLEAEGFVLGLPLDEEGGETARTAEVRAVAEALRTRTGMPVRLVDERYTTAIALRAIRDLGGSTRGRAGDVDSLAATVLLQHALALPATDPGDGRMSVPGKDEAE